MRKVFNFDYGWKFKREEEIKKVSMSDYFGVYVHRQKTGTAVGPSSSFFDDSDWKVVDLPHDWCAYEDFAQENNIGTICGNKPSGKVWYRKSLLIDEKYADKKVYLKFDGIAIESDIYVNSVHIVHTTSGYVPIVCDITDFVEPGRTAIISVASENPIKEGWWYEGGGIYRHTYLIITDNTHFEDDGVYVSAVKQRDTVWDVRIRASIEGYTDHLTLKSHIKGTDKVVESVIESDTVEQHIAFENPMLWDTETPNLYQMICTLYKDGQAIDEQIITFGFREFYFDADKGFFLNGRGLKLKGVCLHHDHSGVGVAIPDIVYEYRLLKLKEMGCNAIRTSHNPQSPAFYDVCDSLGIIIMNENRHFSSSRDELHNLKMFIKRDRNHPCVIMWSLFNEEPLQGSYLGRKIAQTMTNLIKSLDDTRLITGGCNGPFQSEGVTRVVDVMGFNYMQYGYDDFHKLFPKLPIFGSETGSYLSTRGIEKTCGETSHVARFGNVLYENLFPWSANPGDTWKNIVERDFVAGGFYWTGIDYLGEAGPFNWPGVTSNFGAMDLCGFPKDNFYWHKALWNDIPLIKIMPHWDFEECSEVNLCCYSNCDEVEIYINGESIGRFENDKYTSLQKLVKFKVGTVKAVGYINGKAVCSDQEQTPQEYSAINTVVSRPQIAVGSFDAAVLDVYATDKNGVKVFRCSEEAEITVSENAVLLGVGNGDNSCHYNPKGNKIPFFGGCLQVIVGAISAGDITVNIKAGTVTDTVLIKALPDTTDYMKLQPNIMVVQAFNMSDVYDRHPDTDEMQHDYFNWIPTPVGHGKNLLYSGKTGFGCMRGKFSKISLDKTLFIGGLEGDVEIFVNGILVGTHNGPPTDIEISARDFKLKDENSLSFVFNIGGKDCGVHGKVYFK